MGMEVAEGRAQTREELEPLLEEHRRELTGYCYRMLGSAFEAEEAAQRETLRLAFVAALQHLPPRQRAVLILREVLHWQASEAAELLETTVQSVNSSLQRARATIASKHPTEADVFTPGDEKQQKLLDRYLAAFEGYDMEALKAVLAEDAVQCMPP